MPGDLSVTPFWISPSLLTLSSVSSIPAEEAASTVDSELRYWCSELSCCVHKGCSGKGHFSKINISDLNFKWTVLPTFLWPCTLQGVQRTGEPTGSSMCLWNEKGSNGAGYLLSWVSVSFKLSPSRHHRPDVNHVTFLWVWASTRKSVMSSI